MFYLIVINLHDSKNILKNNFLRNKVLKTFIHKTNMYYSILKALNTSILKYKK